MNNIQHSEYEASDYSHMPVLFEIMYYPDDPFLKEIFKDNPELLQDIKWIAFVASKELEDIKNWKELSNYEVINKRIKNKRKSAWFFAFIRYTCKNYRGYVSSRACSSHTFKKFISGKEYKNMMSDVVKSMIHINQS